MKISQPDALSVQGVEVRRLDNGIAETAEVAVALIVGHDQDDVGARGDVGLLTRGDRREAEQQQKKGREGE